MKKNIVFVLLSFYSHIGILIAQTPSVSQLSINEAGAHIGEIRQVDGFIYKTEVKRIDKKQAMVLIYLSDRQRLKSTFVKIIDKVPIKQDKDGTIECKYGTWNLTRLINWRPTSEIGEKAVGKITKHEGLPAIIINYKDIDYFETTFKNGKDSLAN